LPQSSVTLHPICHVERKSLFAAARDLTADDADGTDVMKQKETKETKPVKAEEPVVSLIILCSSP
jgi:hypothetical protein